jgi:hypothetical protein
VIRVCVVGQQLWAKRLEDTLRRYTPGPVQVLTLAAKNLLSPEFRHADILMRIGFRPGARTPLGVGFDAFWSALRTAAPRAAALHYWIGSDVWRTVQDCGAGRLRRGPFSAALRDHHLADAPWLAEELATIGIAARVLAIPAPNLRAQSLPPLPETFRVLTYIPDYRFRFYGGEALYEAAHCLPHIPFEVVGGWGRWAKPPLSNLRFHGWVSEMEPFYRNCPLLVRMVEHDSIGVTVKEALSFGRHVIYSYPLPHTEQVSFADDRQLTKSILDLELRHRKGLLKPNVNGWEYALREFDESRDARALTSILLEIADQRKPREERNVCR